MMMTTKKRHQLKRKEVLVRRERKDLKVTMTRVLTTEKEKRKVPSRNYKRK